MAKSLIELKTDLKSLKYQGVNGSEAPYVVKDIRLPESPSRVGQEIFRRADDTVRMAKALSPTNSRFLENQAKLVQADNSQKLNPVRLNSDGTFLQRVANRALSIAGVAASTLAQVPLAGTGARLGIAFRPTNGSAALQGEVITVSNELKKGNLETRKSSLTNVPTNVLVDGLGLKAQNLTGGFQLDQKLTTGSYLPDRYPGRISGIAEVKDNKDTVDSISKLEKLGSGSLVDSINRNRFDQQTGAVREQLPFAGTDYKTKLSYVPIESRYKMGNQGLVKKSTSYSSSLDLTIDKLNQLDIRNSKLEGSEDPSDLIKFYFTVMVPGEEDKHLYFRAYLDSFNDSYQGNWSETEYVGRGEKMQTYDGFSRNISLSFKIAASTREEMKPLYRKMVYLASTTAPTYGAANFMRGTLVRLTVGDYLYETPGVITSVDYKWDVSYPWEIVLDKEETQQQLPHILDCSIGFRPIHSFIPKTGLNPFITNTADSVNFLV